MVDRRAIAVLGALALAGCNPFVLMTEQQRYTTAADVIAHSTMPFTPPTATRVRYFSEHALDRYEYLYFEDRRDRVDAFARALLGSVPDKVDPRASWKDDDGLNWWPRGTPAVTRSGSQNKDNHGDRQVFIIDGPDRSQVWAFAAAHR